jgi:hypothetical protein
MQGSPMSSVTKKQLAEQKRQATLAENRAKRDAQDLRARMADYFWSQSETISKEELRSQKEEV